MGADEHPLGSLRKFSEKLSTLKGLPALRFGLATAVEEIEMLLRDAPGAMRASGVTALIVDQGQPAGSTLAERLRLPFVTVCNAVTGPPFPDPAVPPSLTPWQYTSQWLGRLRNRAAYSGIEFGLGPVLRAINRARKDWGFRALGRCPLLVRLRIAGMIYGQGPYQDHHGGALWLQDSQGWFLVRNQAGVEWSSQFCADPAKIDLLRQNAKRLYDLVSPQAKQQLDPGGLLDTPITDAAGVAKWTDSIFNAGVPLHPTFHTGVLPSGGAPGSPAPQSTQPAGVHHYPTPIADIQLFKYDDFQLWVTDAQGNPAAVAPVDKRGSGNASVHVLYATPGSQLAQQKHEAESAGAPLILGPNHPLSQQAYVKQQPPGSGGASSSAAHRVRAARRVRDLVRLPMRRPRRRRLPRRQVQPAAFLSAVVPMVTVSPVNASRKMTRNPP